MTDIFTARDRLMQAQMALMDWRAEAREALDAGGLEALNRKLQKPEYAAICDEAEKAAVAYWEIARGRKWPA